MCFLHRCVHIRLLSIKFNTPNKIQPNHYNALTGIFSSDKWLKPWYLWGYAHQYQLHHILDMYLIYYNLVNIKSQYFFEKIFRIFELKIKNKPPLEVGAESCRLYEHSNNAHTKSYCEQEDKSDYTDFLLRIQIIIIEIFEGFNDRIENIGDEANNDIDNVDDSFHDVYLLIFLLYSCTRQVKFIIISILPFFKRIHDVSVKQHKMCYVLEKIYNR